MRRLLRFRDRRPRELARLLVELDRAAAEVRPRPLRRTRVSVAR